MASSSTTSLQNSADHRRLSCETACSSNSSCILKKRKQVNPLSRPMRTSAVKQNPNGVRQRVLSAKLLRLRSLQNQLNDANFHLVELAKENRALKTLQNRQDRALSKYENTNAELPRLLKSHEEEIRFLHEKNKALRKNVKELTELLKSRDDEIANLKEQLRHFMALTKDKNLEERSKLTEKVEELKEKLKSSEEQIGILNRKLMLETKNLKYRWNQETLKNKQLQKDLNMAFTELDRVTGLNEVRTNLPPKKKTSSRQAVSMVSLTMDENDNEKLSSGSETSSVKLGSLTPRKDFAETKPLKSILKPPSENIKARLSAGNRHNIETKRSSLSLNSESLHKHSSESLNKNSSLSQQSKSILTLTSKKSRPSSTQKLDKLCESLQATLKKSSYDPQMNDASENCSEVVSLVQNFSDIVDKRKEDYDRAQTDTKNLLETLKEMDKMDAELRGIKKMDKKAETVLKFDTSDSDSDEKTDTATRETEPISETKSLMDKLKENDKKNAQTYHTNLLSIDDILLPDKDEDIVSQILSEEYSFKNKMQEDAEKDIKDDNGNITQKVSIAPEDKQKLLATLKVIDDGGDVDININSDLRKTKLMKELFGNVNE